jgi:hypothetical protein
LTRGFARERLKPPGRPTGRFKDTGGFMGESDLTLVGVCGLHCGECDVYIAFSEGDLEKQDEIAESISRQLNTRVGPEQIMCGGCHGPEELAFCAGCRIRPCATRRGFTTCAECGDMDSCETLGAFLRTEMGGEARRGLEEIGKLGLERWLAGKIRDRA